MVIEDFLFFLIIRNHLGNDVVLGNDKIFGYNCSCIFFSYRHFMANYTCRRLYEFGTQMFGQERVMWKNCCSQNAKIMMLKQKDCVGQSKYNLHFLLITVKIGLLRNGLYDTKKVNIGILVPRNKDYGWVKPNQTLANKICMTRYCGNYHKEEKCETSKIKQLCFGHVR